MSKSIQRVIKKRAISFPIERFDREDGTYDDEDGIYEGGDSEQDFIRIHIQPIENVIVDGPSGQRSIDRFKGWTWLKISNKDVVSIIGVENVDDGLFTVSESSPWVGVFTEFVLTRSGEAENKVDE